MLLLDIVPIASIYCIESVNVAYRVEIVSLRKLNVSKLLCWVSLNLCQKEESPWELSSSGGESFHCATSYDVI